MSKQTQRVLLLVLNTGTFFLTLYLNYLYGSGAAGKASVGEISNRFDTLITPAGYAFAIWGLIYLLLFGFIGYQWLTFFQKKAEISLDRTGPWLTISNVLNALWIVVWTNEQMVLSVLVIIGLLLVLLRLVLLLDLEMWDAPFATILFVWWPICIYIGWVTVATVVNISVWFYANAWLMSGETFWTIITLTVATGVYLFLIWKRNMREAALVGVWAFLAIAAKHAERNETIRTAAIALTIIILIAISLHAFRNRKTLPLVRVFFRD